ncbi:MAG: hypothetical protein KA312_08750 [Sphingorhabdus sp.]|nr:hypothetical protein [Sphingorhabdus sp.]
MKILLSIAVAVAAFTSVSAASARDRGPGHWEWQSQTAPGPNKSNLPSQVRVWVNDAPVVANCDCAMMQVTAMAADCMAMPRKGGSSSHG